MLISNMKSQTVVSSTISSCIVAGVAGWDVARRDESTRRTPPPAAAAAAARTRQHENVNETHDLQLNFGKRHIVLQGSVEELGLFEFSVVKKNETKSNKFNSSTEPYRTNMLISKID